MMLLNLIKSRKQSLHIVLLGISLSLVAVGKPTETPPELKDIGIEEKFGSRVDLSRKFKNESGQLVDLGSAFKNGKPTLLFLAYYKCPNLCNMFLNGATEGLKKLVWSVGDQFNIVTISINPEEDSALASQKKSSYLESYARKDSNVQTGWNFWVNDQYFSAKQDEKSNVRALANEVGFKYKWDADEEQYAHTSAMIVLTPEGKISRYLYGIDFRPEDIRLALVEAAGNKIGTVVDHLMLYCYRYDPKTRKYALYAENLMKAGGGVTVLFVGGSLLGFWRRSRRSSV